jgi:hypothetical protein
VSAPQPEQDLHQWYLMHVGTAAATVPATAAFTTAVASFTPASASFTLVTWCGC